MPHLPGPGWAWITGMFVLAVLILFFAFSRGNQTVHRRDIEKK